MKLLNFMGSRGVAPISLPQDVASKSKRSILEKVGTDSKVKPLNPTWTARKIFNLAGWVRQELPDRSDRELFSRRIANWLCGRVRNLRFPSNFSHIVRSLSQLSKAQVEKRIYQVTNGNPAGLLINDQLFNTIHHAMPGGCIRTVNTNIRVHLSQSREVLPLLKRDWPRLESRPAWPSTPTFLETLEMGRRGLTPLPFRRYTHTPQWRISMCQFNKDIVLASAIISQQIVGIRSDVRVPGKFLKFFRYRWDMLILTTTWSLPAGLVRFLAAQWKTRPYNLWLRDKCYLKTFLRSTSSSVFNRSLVGPW